ncbi:unnamed protein product [Nippostrongylus brasiliensis]|uniref:DDE_3 domain-containing protein n=1 Tax=Nippostrongylus brasiliensis TaxID=27835 RepID=A0A0N4Y502_NIPBR|nr:unnamed protein product [Nippostrongylus brasiliensis]
MPSTERASIIKLHMVGVTASKIAKRLNASRFTAQKAIKRYKELGTLSDRPRSGCPKTAITPNVVKKVRDKISRNATKSMRKMTKALEVSERSVRRICHNKPKGKCYKKQKCHALTPSMRAARIERCDQLLRRFDKARCLEIVFSDEKLFTIEASLNHQNDRILVRNVEEANQSGRLVERKGHPRQLMVWTAITSDGKSDLVFVEEGVKIDSSLYLEDILKKNLLPWTRNHFGGRSFLFQQHGALAHKSKEVQGWLQRELSDSVSSSEWPPYSSDLNLLDYVIWRYLESKGCATPHRSLDSLRRSLIKAWKEMHVYYMRAVVDSFHDRLRACARAKGGIFET